MRNRIASCVALALLFLALATAAVALPPFGAFDTPADGTTGVQGAIGITGWALDDLGVVKVEIWREAVTGEPAPAGNGQIFIGQATMVAGARPDVAGLFPNYPNADRAAWGYMLLTNLLPGTSSGPSGRRRPRYTLYVYVTDTGGNVTLLPSHTFTTDNANADKPFGTIDTPAQGETVTGIIDNFGWVLTPQPGSIPFDGSTIQLYIDGVPQNAAAQYNLPRQDITDLFPDYANSAGPVGHFSIDTTTLTSGVHTMAWSVTDNLGRGEGIGSRYFTVAGGIATPTPIPVVALVVGAVPLAAGSGDAAIRDRLISEQKNVVVLRDFDAQPSDANGKDLVVITASAQQGNVGTKFLGAAVPVLTSRQNIFDDMSLATDFGTLSGFVDLSIAAPSHPMAAGLSGNVVITNVPRDIQWGVPTTDAVCVAWDPGGDCAIFAYEQGSSMAGGVIAARRRVGYFMEEGTPAVLTNDGWKLFDAAVDWLIDPRPFAAVGGPYQAHLGQSVGFTSFGSFARKGTITGYRWDFGDGSTGSGATPQHVYTAVGTYNAKVTVMDSQLLVASATTTVTITPNLPPTVSVTVSSPTCHPKCTQTFTASASDPEGDPIKFAWSGCATGTTASVTCTLTNVGTATAIVTAQTDRNDPVTAQASFTATNTPPTVLVLPQGASRDALMVTGPSDPDFGADPDDIAVSGRLSQLGYVVSTVLDNNVSTPDRAATAAAGKAFVIISRTARPAYTAGNFNSVAVPVLVNRVQTLGDMHLSIDNDILTLQSQLTIANTIHPLARGIAPGLTTVLLNGNTRYFNYGTPEATATVIATATNGSPSIFAYNPGAVLADGSKAASKRVGFFMADSVPQALNATGWKLFDNAVIWLGTSAGSCTAPCTATFSAFGADADGDTLSYQWLGCAAGQSTAVAECQLDIPGTYTATVTVADPYGGSVTASAQVVAQ